MREIKFEYGFESINGTVKKSYNLHEIPNIKKICDVWNVLPIKYVRQYTGLKDKNGKDIYEGDIIKDSEQIYIVRFGEIETVEIAFIGFYLEHIELIEFNGSFSSFDCPVIEVIGNIYENPELIK